MIRYWVISRWSSPIPDRRCSPVSWLISTRRLASSFPTFRIVSMSFGRSPMCFGSMATVTTGSETCRISSNGTISGEFDIVVPANASVRPMTAAMLPAWTSSTMSRSGPMNSETCWTRFLIFVPTIVELHPLDEATREHPAGGDLPGVRVHRDVGDHERGRTLGRGRRTSPCRRSTSGRPARCSGSGTAARPCGAREVLDDHVEDDVVDPGPLRDLARATRRRRNRRCRGTSPRSSACTGC